jgi:hypothetical protein
MHCGWTELMALRFGCPKTTWRTSAEARAVKVHIGEWGKWRGRRKAVSVVGVSTLGLLPKLRFFSPFRELGGLDFVLFG